MLKALIVISAFSPGPMELCISFTNFPSPYNLIMGIEQAKEHGLLGIKGGGQAPKLFSHLSPV